MREQVEDRLKFFETGELPPKNVDVMREAVKEFFEIQVSSFEVGLLKLFTNYEEKTYFYY